MTKVRPVVMFLAFAVSACGSLEPGDRNLQDNRELFQRAVGDSYVYDYRNVRFAIGPVVEPVRIRVRRSAIVSVVSISTGREVSPDSWRYYETVEALFRTIEDGYAKNAAEVRVQYHAELGYPTDVYIDYDRRLADEEAGYVLSNLVPERN